MKLKVIGWVNSDNTHFEEGDNSLAAHYAIIEDIRANGYDFSGWHHQEAENGAPVLNDGKIRRYSQRGWGSLMADVNGEQDPHAYSLYAFSFGKHGEDVKMPGDDRNAEAVIHNLAKELLSPEQYDFLFEDDYTTHFPHPELGDFDIYTLTEEEADSVSFSDTVRQLPNIIFKKMAGEGAQESFDLDKYDCKLSDNKITLKMCDELKSIEKGDTVTLNGKSYTVKAAQEYKGISEKTSLDIMYSHNEGYEKALEILKKADLLLDIFI